MMNTNLFVEIIGYIATALIVVAYIPQVIETYKKQSAEGISSKFLLLMSVSCFLWVIYGACVDSIPLILTNTLSLLQVAFILQYKLNFKKND